MVGGGVNDLTQVGGNLTLDGMLNVTALSGFGNGTYTIITYSGALTDNGLTLGSMPSGFGYGLAAGGGDVELIVGASAASGPTQYWDGAHSVGNGVVDGGSGTWNASNTNWTDAGGVVDTAWGSQVAVFEGAAGNVSVVGSITITGMQFLTTGYDITPGAGGTLTTNTASTGMFTDTGITATIAVVFGGSGGLDKTGAGTLVLTGNNTYSGGTAIDGGTLQIGAGNASGSILGNVADNGTLAFDRSDVVTYSGIVSGNGSVVQSGNGTLVLTGNNTYTGTTTIAGGTLQLGNGSTSGLVAGNVADNGALVFDRSDTMTVAGLISGNGTVQQAGNGTVVLTGNSTYTGGTAISSGTLQLGNGGTSGSVAGNITNNGALVFDRSDTMTVAGLVSGNGSVQQLGNGTTILTGNNTYSGATTISAGTLQLGNGNASGAIAGNVTDNGTFAINRSDSFTFGNVISGSGAFRQTGNGTTIFTNTETYTGGTTIAAGTLQLGNGGAAGSIAGNVTDNGTLAFDRSDAVTFANVISGNGAVVKTGAGITTLTATNTYTGATTVNAGTLSVNGSIAASSGVTVNAGGTLSGTGTVAKTTINGGTIAPGNNGIGSIGVAGNLTITSSGTYAADIGPSTADLVSVTGAATLSGTLEAVAAGGTYHPGMEYTLVTATGGISGTFSTLTIVGSLGPTRPRLAYDADDVFLILDPNALTPILVGATPNERATAGGIDTSLLGGNAPAAFLALFNLTAPQINQALDALSGEIHASVKESAIDDTRFVRQAVMGRLRSAFYGSGRDCGACRRCPDGRRRHGRAGERRAVGTGFWFVGGTDTDGNAGAMNRTIGGVVAGADSEFAGHWRLGLAGGYSQTTDDVSSRASSADTDSAHIAAYAGGGFGPWTIRLGAANSWDRFATTRQVVFTGINDTLKAHYSGNAAQAFGEIGYALTDGDIAAEPFAGLAYVFVHTDGFTETGSTVALASAGSDQGVGYSTLGIRLASNMGLGGDMTITPRASLAWQHGFGTLLPTTNLLFAGTGAEFTIAGLPLAQDSALIDAGFDFHVTPSMMLSVSYSGQWGAAVHDNGIKANLEWNF